MDTVNDRPGSFFSLTDSRLDPRKWQGDLANAQAGALVTFEGWVRNHNEGHAVERLEYEAFEALAEKEGAQVIREALSRFGIADAICIHRTGRLIVGDCAVWVGVTAAHRDAAFQAARYIIDEIKSRLPIWKKEHYKDGDAVWVNCQQCTQHASAMQLSAHFHPVRKAVSDAVLLPAVTPSVPSESAYYQRQLLLKEVGDAGQARLQATRVLVVGAGGLGSAALMYLAGAGVGTLGIVEFDSVEASNLHRQPLYTLADLTLPKAEAARHHLLSLNPHIQIETHAEALSAQNAETLLADYDLILDCSDNFDTRFVLNDAASALQKPLIQASVYQYEGQIHLFNPQKGACLRCQWPQGLPQALTPSCRESGVLGPVPALLGTMQAMEAMKWILGLATPLDEQLLIVDLLTWQTRLIRRVVNPDCPVCASHQTHEIPVSEMSALITPASLLDGSVEPASLMADTERVHGGEMPESEWALVFSPETPYELKNYVWVDVSEAREHVPLPSVTVQNIPFSRFELEHPPPIDKARKYLLYCVKGVRSSHLARELRKRGYTNVFALAGGLQNQDLTLVLKRLKEAEQLYYVRH